MSVAAHKIVGVDEARRLVEQELGREWPVPLEWDGRHRQ